MKKSILISMMLLCTIITSAQRTTEVQVDTMVCNVNCIQKYVECPTANGKSTRIYAVYNDNKNQINELIPVSKTVYQYIEMCRQNGIKPNLGIRLRNGQISSIVRYKQRFIRR